MQITWLGHASFLIESGGRRIITDPYDPRELNLRPVDVPADLVIRSSADDIAHACTEFIPEPFELVTATGIGPAGVCAAGVKIAATGAQESIYREGGYRDNALYRFSLEGITIAHMGDVGNPLTREQLDFLAGTDILLALAGGHPTIAIDDLVEVIATVRPALVIPMHFRVPGPRFPMLPVTELTGRYPGESVTFSDDSAVPLDASSLPAEGARPRLLVLKPQLLPEDAGDQRKRSR